MKSSSPRSKVALIDDPRKTDVAQATRTKQFAGREPVIQSVTETICYRFEQGALESYLSRKYDTRREFIEAVIRREFRRLAAENRALRGQLRKAA